MSKENRKCSIKVLISRVVKFEGEDCLVPVEVEINGRVFTVDFDDGAEMFPFGNIKELTVAGLKDVKLGEIPNFLTLNCESEDIGWLKFSICSAYLEISHRRKYYDRYLRIDDYFETLKKIALKRGFGIVDYNVSDDYYRLEVSKDFPPETTVKEASESFKQIFTEISEVEGKAESLIKSLLKSLEQSETVE